mmetsp:Transcript_21985/g.18851  ORF Transcript_21985/g.18851 Transcript_21985/m.18851 type:complete len:110 (+) Transcript_21985:101-430(+)
MENNPTNPSSVILKENLKFEGTMSKTNTRWGFFPKFFLGASLGLFFLAGKRKLDAYGAQHEIDFRKRQLSRPAYVLQGAEKYEFPWNKENLDEWRYRRVKVAGRQIPRL